MFLISSMNAILIELIYTPSPYAYRDLGYLGPSGAPLSAGDSCTDKKENKIFLIYKEIQMGSGAKSYIRKGFLIYKEMRKVFPMYEEAVSHI
jgi:hypothetical protein